MKIIPKVGGKEKIQHLSKQGRGIVHNRNSSNMSETSADETIGSEKHKNNKKTIHPAHEYPSLSKENFVLGPGGTLTAYNYLIMLKKEKEDS
jgi:hypothetical protein